jgi:DNA-binding MarR family transcriptional regulator
MGRFLKLSREAREMAVLDAVERDSTVSQRGLARAAGVSATMINAYVDGLVGRGWLEVTGDTNRTYRYFLTLSGRVRRDELRRDFAREVEEFYRAFRQPPAQDPAQPAA